MIGQCEGISCIMISRIELKCDTCVLGSLYIVIMYNVFRVLSLKSVVISLAPKFVIVVFFLSMTHCHHNVIIYGTFVIKHCKFLNLNEYLLFLFHLNKKYVMLINLDLQGHLQNVMLKGKY